MDKYLPAGAEFRSDAPWRDDRRAEWFSVSCYQALRKEVDVETTDYDDEGEVTTDALEDAFYENYNTPLGLIEELSSMCRKFLKGELPDKKKCEHLIVECEKWDEDEFFVERA